MARTLMAHLPLLFRSLESVGKISHSCRFRIIWGDLVFFYKNGILCLHIRIASMRRFSCEHTIYLQVKENRKYIPTVPSDLTQGLTLISTNYPCLELIFMVPKVFKPLKFDCIAKKKVFHNVQACGSINPFCFIAHSSINHFFFVQFILKLSCITNFHFRN